MCTFLPLLAVSSGEAVSGTGQGCMFLLGDSLLPSPLYACMGVSPALTQDFQAPGFLEFSPSSIHLLPALPLGKGPQPGLTPHSLPQWCLWLAPGPARLPGGADWLWQRCREGILLAGVLLWPLTCEPPATLGPPSLSVPTGLSVSFSAGLVTQPCNLTWTHFFFSLLDLRP